MVRLIDANEAIKKAKESDKIVRSSIWETGEVVEFLEGSPTVDAVEVVRCKDCAKEGTEQCPMVHRDSMFGNLYAETKPMGFCSYGERKSDEN